MDSRLEKEWKDHTERSKLLFSRVTSKYKRYGNISKKDMDVNKERIDLLKKLVSG